MAEQKTKPTIVSVEEFINAVPDERKRKDSFELLKMMKDVAKQKPRMWGPTMIGFGECHYKYDSGHEGDCFRIGFSPRKSSFSLYVTCDASEMKEYLNKLGKHKAGKGCIYFKRMDDIDRSVLKKMIEMAWNKKVKNFTVVS
jgi:hypothetical protein